MVKAKEMIPVRVLVLNGSPKGENSITLQTVRYLERRFPDCTFDVLHVGQRIRSIEKDFSAAEDALNRADLLLFCYPVYTFLVPSQLHRFIELIFEHGVDLKGKYATQITTSLHFYDVTAHRFVQENCDDLGLRYLTGLSADMEDLLKAQGRSDAEAFFRHALWAMAHGFSEPRAARPAVPFAPAPFAGEIAPVEKDPAKRIVIVADRTNANGALNAMIDRFCAQLPFAAEVFDLGAFPFAGGCLGCFHCAADGTCIYRDNFDAELRTHIQSAQAIVYAFSIRNHSMGYRMKLFDDRQFCNGHRTVTMGKPVGYLVDGPLSEEPNLKMLIEARADVGGNCLAGIASNELAPDERIAQLCAQLGYAVAHAYLPPRTFYGVGGMKVFRDLIYQMRGLMREDHRFYKAHGFYDFPQKRKGRIAGMYLVGAMMRNRKLQKKIGGRMTEGMLMPYKKVLENAGEEPERKEDRA